MNAWDQFAASIFSFSLAPKAVWITVAIVIIIFFISTLILRYHWKEYGRGENTLVIADQRYTAGGIFFLLVVLAAAIAYSL